MTQTVVTPDTDRTARAQPGLHIIATPIGNLGDISLRALETLKSVDAILCEDTRVTGILLTHHGIAKTLVAYHDHNAARQLPKIMARLQEGDALALVSDAGTPLISDPGYRLVREAIEAGIAVTALPGANAAITGLQLSGLPSDRFVFLGFLPPKSGARVSTLTQWRDCPATLVAYETRPRLAAMIADAATVFGPDRPATIARELTKLYESVYRGSLGSLTETLTSHAIPEKGECVVVIGPAPESTEDTATLLDDALRAALAENSVRDAASLVATATGLPKKQVYARALALMKTRN